ncbi:MAG: hypothetical protein ACYTAS_06940 [Planctomycetota bacterium]|jgi:hypothetical protein
MKTRRVAARNATRRAGNDVRATGTSIVSLRTTNSEKTKHRVSPELGPSLQAGALRHDLIAEPARIIWLERRYSPDQDEENWCDAEAQLKTDMGTG